MKQFIAQVIILSLLVFLCSGWVLSGVNGYTDPFYFKFTTPRQNNLIIGTSRAAQGIVPEILKEELHKPFLNYAFTIEHSPFGKSYYTSIMKKVEESAKTGTYIITVDPWSISSKTKEPNDQSKFRELKTCVEKMSLVNMNPNLEYLVDNLNGRFHTFFSSEDSTQFLHKDGWLEISITMDSAIAKNRKERKIKTYEKQNLPSYKFSSVRFQYLKETIMSLKEHGEVYLVRLPVHEEMMDIENKLMPEFDAKINQIVPMTSGYFNMTSFNNDFIYTDGNHLHKSSARKVTKEICKWIKAQKIP